MGRPSAEVLAIRQFCLECQGVEDDAPDNSPVMDCSSGPDSVSPCPLFPYRCSGLIRQSSEGKKKGTRKKREYTPEQREAMLKRMEKARAARFKND